jgi:uncharacterized protein YjbI with pentapeptide repeats
MANQDHLKILNQGVGVWNRWRDRNIPKVYRDMPFDAALFRRAARRGFDLTGVKLIDLQNADLRGMNLSQVNLSRTDLTGADLTGADLRWAFLDHARLREANLSKKVEVGGATYFGADISQSTRLGGAGLFEADLSGANLVGADLFGARLRRAILQRVDFEEADLSWTDLRGANLHRANLLRAKIVQSSLDGADFNGVAVGLTTFAEVDLSHVIGLDTVVHQYPSTIGIDAIYSSKGKIPVVFLRGAGIPDVFISYIGPLVGQPIQYYSCFISYSNRDQAFTERLHADL